MEKEVAAQDSILVPCDNAYRGVSYQCWLVHCAMDFDLHGAGVNGRARQLQHSSVVLVVLASCLRNL